MQYNQYFRQYNKLFPVHQQRITVHAAIVVVLAAVGGTTTPVAGTYALANAASFDLKATPATGFVFDHWVIGGFTDGSRCILIHRYSIK